MIKFIRLGCLTLLIGLAHTFSASAALPPLVTKRLGGVVKEIVTAVKKNKPYDLNYTLQRLGLTPAQAHAARTFLLAQVLAMLGGGAPAAQIAKAHTIIGIPAPAGAPAGGGAGGGAGPVPHRPGILGGRPRGGGDGDGSDIPGGDGDRPGGDDGGIVPPAPDEDEDKPPIDRRDEQRRQRAEELRRQQEELRRREQQLQEDEDYAQKMQAEEDELGRQQEQSRREGPRQREEERRKQLEEEQQLKREQEEERRSDERRKREAASRMKATEQEQRRSEEQLRQDEEFARKLQEEEILGERGAKELRLERERLREGERRRAEVTALQAGDELEDQRQEVKKAIGEAEQYLKDIRKLIIGYKKNEQLREQVETLGHGLGVIRSDRHIEQTQDLGYLQTLSTRINRIRTEAEEIAQYVSRQKAIEKANTAGAGSAAVHAARSGTAIDLLGGEVADDSVVMEFTSPPAAGGKSASQRQTEAGAAGSYEAEAEEATAAPPPPPPPPMSLPARSAHLSEAEEAKARLREKLAQDKPKGSEALMEEIRKAKGAGFLKKTHPSTAAAASAADAGRGGVQEVLAKKPRILSVKDAIDFIDGGNNIINAISEFNNMRATKFSKSPDAFVNQIIENRSKKTGGNLVHMILQEYAAADLIDKRVRGQALSAVYCDELKPILIMISHGGEGQLDRVLRDRDNSGYTPLDVLVMGYINRIKVGGDNVKSVKDFANLNTMVVFLTKGWKERVWDGQGYVEREFSPGACITRNVFDAFVQYAERQRMIEQEAENTQARREGRAPNVAQEHEYFASLKELLRRCIIQ